MGEQHQWGNKFRTFVPVNDFFLRDIVCGTGTRTHYFSQNNNCTTTTTKMHSTRRMGEKHDENMDGQFDDDRRSFCTSTKTEDHLAPSASTKTKVFAGNMLRLLLNF